MENKRELFNGITQKIAREEFYDNTIKDLDIELFDDIWDKNIEIIEVCIFHSRIINSIQRKI